MLFKGNWRSKSPIICWFGIADKQNMHNTIFCSLYSMLTVRSDFVQSLKETRQGNRRKNNFRWTPTQGMILDFICPECEAKKGPQMYSLMLRIMMDANGMISAVYFIFTDSLSSGIVLNTLCVCSLLCCGLVKVHKFVDTCSASLKLILLLVCNSEAPPPHWSHAVVTGRSRTDTPSMVRPRERSTPAPACPCSPARWGVFSGWWGSFSHTTFDQTRRIWFPTFVLMRFCFTQVL